MTKTMTKKELYLEASRRLAEDEETYSCNSIAHLSPDYRQHANSSIASTPEVEAYCSVFDENNYFYGFVKLVGADEDSKNLRVMMTSLMAVCWQDFQ